MQLVAGSRLRSQVCSTEVVVVRGGEVEGDITCGGSPLVAMDAVVSEGTPASGLDTGTSVGKRYTATGDVELLVTKGGAGSLGLDKTPLDIKGARPLPSSD
jgi:hypothetical protein